MSEDRKQKLSSIYHAASPYGWLILLIAVAWFYVAALLYSKNWYGVYQPRVLIKGLVVIPLIYVGLALVFGKLILPRLKDNSWKRISILLIFAPLQGFGKGREAAAVEGDFRASVIRPRTKVLVDEGRDR